MHLAQRWAGLQPCPRDAASVCNRCCSQSKRSDSDSAVQPLSSHLLLSVRRRMLQRLLSRQRGMQTGCSGSAHGRCICRSITVPCRHHAELLNALDLRHGRLARWLQGSCGVGAEDAICVLSLQAKQSMSTSVVRMLSSGHPTSMSWCAAVTGWL